jgi:hypothetical protein
VGREQDGLAERAERADHLPGGAARGGVESRGRLVEEQHLRVADQAQAEVEPAFLPPGERADPRRALLLEPDEPDHLVDVQRLPVVAGEELQALGDAQVRIHRRRLEDDSDSIPPVEAGSLWVLAEHLDRSAVARPVALQDLDRCRLAGAVGAEQSEDLARRDLEVDAPHCLVRAVRLVQIRDRDRRHA